MSEPHGEADRRGGADAPPRPFGTWNGREPWNIFPTVSIHAVGGDQVLIARVVYEPGTVVPRHSHEVTEQVMWILDGAVTMTVGGETRELTAGDTVVVNRGVEHELRSEGGVSFLEALAPVPLDHVPDPERDLVLGDLRGSLHVER